MIIAKFGGTSVNSKKSILALCKIVKNELNNQPVVVVSALRGVTDILLSLPNLKKTEIKKELEKLKDIHLGLIDDLSDNTAWRRQMAQYIAEKNKEIEVLKKEKNSKAILDKLASYGEIISSFIITQALNDYGIKSRQFIATELVVTDDNFGSAEFLVKETKHKIKKNLVPVIKKGLVAVVTGYIGATTDGRITTLGRGGSDYSASILGFCLGAREIQIWTDVDGIMTADPKIIGRAKSVELVSYEEASELARLGAKVLHPKTILPAIEKNIPVKILNIESPFKKGTTILNNVNKADFITSIACKKGVCVINIHAPKMFGMVGFMHEVFSIFDKLRISVDFISTSEVNISLTIDGKYATRELVKALEELADVEIKNKRATVSVVGRPSGSTPMIRGKIYALFEKHKIDLEMISLGASKINETIVVEEDKADEIVRILHKNLFAS